MFNNIARRGLEKDLRDVRSEFISTGWAGEKWTLQEVSLGIYPHIEGNKIVCTWCTNT
jgi:hypothetical protein